MRGGGLGVGRQKAVHAVADRERQAAYHGRALPERLERGQVEALAERSFDHRAREQQEGADLEAPEALVGG